MDRDKTIDCLKGYACFLVVFGHVILGIRNMGGVRLPTLAYPIEQFIWSFHVPIFFFCSGYVFQINGGWKRSRNRTEFLKHKLLNLGVPYFAFSMLYILINSLVPGTNSRFSVADLVSLWRKPIAQYWYLYALFMLFFLYVALSRRLTDPQITVLLLIVRYICALFSVLIPLVGYAVSNCVAFGLGVSFRDLKIIERRKVFACGMGIVQVGFFVGAYGFGLLSCPVVEDLLRALGAVTSVMVISCVCEKKMIQKAALLINKYSFPIFLLHTIFTAGVRIILKRAGTDSYFIHLILGTLLGMGAPAVGYYIASKWWPVDFFFYPSLALDRFKERRGRIVKK